MEAMGRSPLDAAEAFPLQADKMPEESSINIKATKIVRWVFRVIMCGSSLEEFIGV
jgi:hypothetical protein